MTKTVKIPELEEAMARDPPHTIRHQWTEEEEEILKTYHQTVKHKYLAKHFEVSHTVLERKIAEMRGKGLLPP